VLHPAELSPARLAAEQGIDFCSKRSPCIVQRDWGELKTALQLRMNQEIMLIGVLKIAAITAAWSMPKPPKSKAFRGFKSLVLLTK
ncbi:MAG: hypothetical protein K2X27_24310, partial [Candidatus Obscuribacterales bacterium]|nr:hypothetical protein [Candidatus Obscuribacterales bacterium]